MSRQPFSYSNAFSEGLVHTKKTGALAPVLFDQKNF